MYGPGRRGCAIQVHRVSCGLARFSTKPVRTVASSVGLSFPVPNCVWADDEAADRCQKGHRPSQLVERSEPCNGNAEGRPRASRVTMRTPVARPWPSDPLTPLRLSNRCFCGARAILCRGSHGGHNPSWGPRTGRHALQIGRSSRRLRGESCDGRNERR